MFNVDDRTGGSFKSFLSNDLKVFKKKEQYFAMTFKYKMRVEFRLKGFKTIFSNGFTCSDESNFFLLTLSSVFWCTLKKHINVRNKNFGGCPDHITIYFNK